MRIEQSIDIFALPERVWAIIEDIERWPEWTSSIRHVERLTPGPLAAGTAAQICQPGIKAVTWTVTDVTPGQAFTWEARNPGLRSVARHRVEAAGEGHSRVTLSVDQAGPLAPLLGLVMGKRMRAFVSMEANGLKQRAERPVRPPRSRSRRPRPPALLHGDSRPFAQREMTGLQPRAGDPVGNSRAPSGVTAVVGREWLQSRM